MNNILHSIAGTPEDKWKTLPPPTSCEAYNELNKRLQKPFVPGALYQAAAGNNHQRVKRILAEHPEAINYEGGVDRHTAIWIAACHCRKESLDLLITHPGSDVNVGCMAPHGPAPIAIAIHNGHLHSVQKLLAAGAKLTADMTKDKGSGLFELVKKTIG
mmetsp:Transcript_5583/g.16608  ORF Transcript_5583/g.16608 Transcript_5583/m.16608 type:complete len:159 (+) Transcript_5583:828-1304(+)